jgi:ubiquinone/menaquinone biosynthesis C-methylase UbiE
MLVRPLDKPFVIEYDRREYKQRVAIAAGNKDEDRTMPNSHRSQEEHPNTYFVEDRSKSDEMTRLALQDHLLTKGMGGVLPEQPDPERFSQVLDIACGTGGWLIDAARTFPGMQRLVGIDVNERLLTYARAQAQAQQVGDRLEFQVMDVLHPLTFAENVFDLVNERMGASYVRTWEWPHLFGELRRVTRPGGIVRLTECENIVESSSPALLRLNELLFHALYQAGHYFSPQSSGLTQELPHLFEQQGFQQVQTRLHVLEYRGNTKEGKAFAEDSKYLFRMMPPFLSRWIRLPDDYEMLYQRLLEETQRPDFTATWRLLTVWGTRP